MVDKKSKKLVKDLKVLVWQKKVLKEETERFMKVKNKFIKNAK